MTTELNTQTVGYDHYLGVLEVRKSNKAYRCFQEVRTTRLKVKLLRFKLSINAKGYYLSWTFQNCSSFKFQFIWKNGVQVGLLDNGINRLSFFGEWKEINENELFSKQNNREVKFSRNLPTTGSMAGGFLEYPASLFSEHETCDKN